MINLIGMFKVLYLCYTVLAYRRAYVPIINVNLFNLKYYDMGEIH